MTTSSSLVLATISLSHNRLYHDKCAVGQIIILAGLINYGYIKYRAAKLEIANLDILPENVRNLKRREGVSPNAILLERGKRTLRRVRAFDQP